MLKTLFFGTSAFAVPSLQTVARLTNLSGVVTQPTGLPAEGTSCCRPRQGSGARAADSHVRACVAQVVREEMAAESFDLFALASYGRILPRR